MQNGAKKIIIYISLIVIGFTTGYKTQAIQNKIEIQEFRNTKTAECFVEQKDNEFQEYKV
jgi:hypothetical protein